MNNLSENYKPASHDIYSPFSCYNKKTYENGFYTVNDIDISNMKNLKQRV